MFDGLIDIISISLNTPNKERYLELTRSKFGIESFDAMIKFAENLGEWPEGFIKQANTLDPVSYTHLDVYKRQQKQSIKKTYQLPLPQ